ncbi:MAG TPA: ferredoxin family protein [Iamia sp.]|jgi:NAD-dependent dihydropyrimidine dehydrogenase PreA subunit|nr:ferredoxin family protein [Iamia sp.]
MIEVISGERCIDCDLCVKVCPTDVFDAVEGDHPVIARQGDCQTCFLCEAYCPVDAMFVAPTTDPLPIGSNLLDERWLVDADLLGGYRRDLGWNKGAAPTAGRDPAGRFLASMHGDPGPIRLPPPAPYRSLSELS